jgi:hypothetical protein
MLRRAVSTRARAVAAALILLVATAGTGRATVFAWREGGTLHLANDPTETPPGVAPRRFEARTARRVETERGRGRGPVAAGAGPARVPARIAASQTPAPVMIPAPAMPAIVLAPTIVVRAGPPRVIVIDGGWESGAWGFQPTGLIGHEHPQIGFLSGRRLVSHSHFFARGRPGRFTPYGHFTHHGLLRPHLP